MADISAFTIEVMFSEKCSIYLGFCNRNIYIWMKDNPHIYEEIKNNPPHVMIWAAMAANHLFAIYFLYVSVILQMMNEWLFPEPRAIEIMDIVTFQQDGV